MTEAIIDAFEVVHVGKEQGHRAVVGTAGVAQRQAADGYGVQHRAERP
jgi:hypothetical protein